MRRVVLAAVGLAALGAVVLLVRGARVPGSAAADAGPLPVEPEPGGPRPPGSHRAPVTALLPAGARLASADLGGELVVWDLAAGRPELRWVAHDGPVRALLADGDGLASVGSDGSVARWSWAGEPRGRLRLPGGRLSDGAAAGGGFAVAADKGTVALLAGEGVRWRQPALHGAGALALAVSPDGARLATGGAEPRIQLLDPATGARAADWVAHDGWVTALAWAGGTLYSGGSDGRLNAWEPGDGTRRWSAEAHAGPVVALAADERRVVTGGEDGAARLWGTDGVPGPVLSGGPGPVRAVALGGGLIHVGGADGRICRYDAENGRPAGILPAETGEGG